MKQNIHQILNKMERYFPYKRKKITVSSISNDHIYIRIYYAIDEKLTEKGYNEKWTGNSAYNHKPGDTVNCSIVLKIWNERYDEKEHNGNRLILFCDNIYINQYVMPDYTMAKAFFDAQEKWISKTDYLLGGWEIELGKKLKKEAVNACIEKVKNEKENLEKCLNKKDIKGIQNHIDEMEMVNQMLNALAQQNEKEGNVCQN